MPPLISVNLITRNNGKFLEEAIQSVLTQIYKNMELIIVDDNSTDNTKEIIETFKTKLNIKYIYNEKQMGLGYSRNLALKHSKGEYIAIIDGDDVWIDDNKLIEQVRYLEGNKDVSMLFTQWREIDENGNIKDRRPTQHDFSNLRKNFFIKSLILNPTMMARKTVFENNLYYVLKGSRGEDFGLFIKLIRDNHRIDILEKVSYLYRTDNSLVTERMTKIRNYSRNMLKILYKEWRYFWNNPYFYFYILRIFGEFLISRNEFLYRIFYKKIATIAKRIFKSV